MASVPAIAVLLARATGAGVTLWVALAAVGIVFVTGALAFAVKGAARGARGPLLPSPDVVRDPRGPLLAAGGVAPALATMPPMPAAGGPLLGSAAGRVRAGALVAGAGPVTATPGKSPASGGATAASAGGAGNAPPGGARDGPGSEPGKPIGTGRPAGPAPGSARTLVAPAGSAGSPASAEAGGLPGPAYPARPPPPRLREAALAVLLALTPYPAHS